MRSRVMRLVASVCVHNYMCIYMWPKKLAVWGLTTWKPLVGVIYFLLVKFNCQKRSFLCQVIPPGKEILKHSINGTEEKKVFGKLYYGRATPRLCAMRLCNRMQCYTNAYLPGRQQAIATAVCRPTISLQVESVLIMLSAHRVCVLWNTSLDMHWCICMLLL